jgi:hypothetical protein
MPFDPDVIWGAKDRHYVAGWLDGNPLRGKLTIEGGVFYLKLGPAWNCGRHEDGKRVTARITPEGPQLSTIASDLAEALRREPAAARFFESLATFYREGWVRWIENAKRPGTRAKRIDEALAALTIGQRDRSRPAIQRPALSSVRLRARRP